MYSNNVSSQSAVDIFLAYGRVSYICNSSTASGSSDVEEGTPALLI